MARPRTGTVEPHRDHFDARVRLANGKLGPRICLDPSLTHEDAKREAAELQRVHDIDRVTDAAPGPSPRAAASGPTCDAWAQLWFADRERRGLSSVRDDRGRWKKWIAPVIGARPMRAVTRDELESIVERLDAAVIDKTISWKTAVNAWAVVTKAFDDSAHAKTRDLRVRQDNPAAGIRGPDRGAVIGLQYLSPAEMLRLVGCAEVPLVFRRAVVLGCYLLCRAAELVPLAWDAVDLAAGVVHVHVALDRKRQLKSTKGKKTRRVPIEPTLRPLLEAMHRECGGRGRVLPLGDGRHLARDLKKYLRIAGVLRRELFITDATRRAIRFHDLRASGITWHAIRGLDPLKIMARSGHEDFPTMRAYLRDAEILRPGFGDVFPALPLDALGVRSSGGQGGSSGTPGHGAPNVPIPPNECPKASQTLGNQGERVERETGLESSKNKQFRMVSVGVRTHEGADTYASEADPYASTAGRRPNAPDDRAEHAAGERAAPGGRGDAIGRLAGMLATFAAAGDLDGARTMHEALGRLMGPAAAPQPGAEVVSLEAERRRRAAS